MITQEENHYCDLMTHANSDYCVKNKITVMRSLLMHTTYPNCWDMDLFLFHFTKSIIYYEINYIKNFIYYEEDKSLKNGLNRMANEV